MQISGNFDLKVDFIEVGIPYNFKENWLAQSKFCLRPVLVNFGQLYLVKHASENKDMGSWDLRQKEMNETFNERYTPPIKFGCHISQKMTAKNA